MTRVMHLFVINPAAGKTDSTARIRAEIEKIFGKSSSEYEIYVTQSPGECVPWLKNRLEADPSPVRVYACGGDGTLNEVLNGIVGFEHASLACYPCGTANDFIKIFGTDCDRIFGDIGALGAADEKRIDIMRCTSDSGATVRHAINICSVGLDARVARDVHRYSKFPLIGGQAAYILSLIVNVIRGISETYTVAIDGRENTGRHAIVVAANGRFYGGSFHAVPEAMPDDGLCDFLSVTKLGRIKLAQIIGRFKDGRHRDIPDYVSWSRGKTLRVTAKKPFAANVDGEVWMTRDAAFSIVPGGLSFAVPNGASWSNQE